MASWAGPGKFKLPINKNIGKLDVCIDKFDKACYDELYKMMEDASRKGDGFSVSEISERAVKGWMNVGKTISFTNKANGDLISVLILRPSTLCRSTKPMANSGLIITNPAYR